MDTSLLPVARHRHPDLRRRHGRLAREALRRHAPQRCRPRPTSCACREPRRRARLEGRDLSPSRIADVSLSAVTAGFVAVLVGFTSSVAIVFQAAQSLGATPAQSASWMWALGWGMGLATLLPSLWLRKPVMIAWSTPGAAVLAVAGASGGFAMAEATGAFIVCAALIVVAGATGLFERAMAKIPMPLAGALLAGVLARFGLDAFLALRSRARPGAGDARRLPARAAPLAALRRRRRARRRRRDRRRDRPAAGRRRAVGASPCRCSPRPSSAGGRR